MKSSNAGRRQPLTGLSTDVRYGFRMLIRQRSFTGIAILTMAAGIGIMTTLFSVAYGVLLKPLPWPEADRLTWLGESHAGASRQNPWKMTNGAYLAWKNNPSTVEAVGGWSVQTVTLSGAGETERIQIATVTASTFSILRAVPLIGSVFDAADELPEAYGKIVLSYGLWQERFAGNASVLGQSLQLDGKSYLVAGVMRREFAFPNATYRAWVPLHVPSVFGRDGVTQSTMIFNAIARLRPGVTPAQAAAEATARARSEPLPEMAVMMWFGTNSPADIIVTPALDAITQDVRPALITLCFAVALLLLTAVANIAGLQLARALGRRREMAIRSAIGAGAGRITQQLLVENLLLCIAGGAGGLAVAVTLHRTLPLLLAPFPRLDDVAINAPLAAFVLLLTLICGIALGLLPSLYLRRINLAETIADDGTSTIGIRKGGVSRMRSLIMTAQVAVACMLLIAAALLSRSLLSMMKAERGYDPQNTFTARLVFPAGKFSAETQLDLIEMLSSRLRMIPGVTRVGFADSSPLSGSEMISGFTMPSKKPPAGERVQVHATRHVVSGDYFAALGIRAVKGRTFSAADTAASAKVVVVNRAFAGQYLSDDPLNDSISNFARGNGVDYTVVGIVEDVMERDLAYPVQPEIYSLARQTPGFGVPSTLIVRTAGDAGLILDRLKNMVREADSGIAIDRIATLADRVSGSLAKPRLYALLLGTFAGSALLIAGIGLFAVLSYNVAQRTRELAIRAALGAPPGRVVGLIVRQGIGITVCGLAAGMWVSFVFVRYLSALLYGVKARDWPSFIGVSLVIAAGAVLACIVPAVRALRIDPVKALRAP